MLIVVGGDGTQVIVSHLLLLLLRSLAYGHLFFSLSLYCNLSLHFERIFPCIPRPGGMHVQRGESDTIRDHTDIGYSKKMCLKEVYGQEREGLHNLSIITSSSPLKVDR